MRVAEFKFKFKPQESIWNVVSKSPDDTDLRKRLVEKKQWIHAEHSKFGTPLCHACRNKQARVVELLLAHGASPHPRLHNEQETPLVIATRNRNLDILNLLFEHNVVPSRSNDALRLACEQQHLDLIRVFESHACRANTTDLLWAKDKQAWQTLECLISTIVCHNTLRSFAFNTELPTHLFSCLANRLHAIDSPSIKRFKNAPSATQAQQRREQWDCEHYCAVCWHIQAHIISLVCGHTLCETCAIQQQESHCPVCRTPYVRSCLRLRVPAT